MASGETQSRLDLLAQLLMSGTLSTQEELAQELGRKGYQVTQSTISRDLRRLSASKSIDSSGRTVYRLLDENPPAPVPSSNLEGLVLNVAHNGAMVVIHTTPGSASLVARHLDAYKSEGILGTIAGDDTIFVAPTDVKLTAKLMNRLADLLADI